MATEGGPATVAAVATPAETKTIARRGAMATDAPARACPEPRPEADPPTKLLAHYRVELVAAGMVLTIAAAIFVGAGGLNALVPGLGDRDWQYVRVFVAAQVVLVGLFWLFAETVGPSYLGAMWLIGPRVPGVAALAVVLAYLIPPDDHPVHLAAVGLGTYAAFVAWVVLGVVFRGAGYADESQAKVYSELVQRMRQLTSRLEAGPSEPSGPAAAIARREACDQLAFADELLHRAPDKDAPNAPRRAQAGVDWASGTAYLSVWQAVHRAEEALYEIEPRSALVGDALHDDLRLTNSTISDETVMRLSLQHAVAEIDPDAMKRYFPGLPTSGSIPPVSNEPARAVAAAAVTEGDGVVDQEEREVVARAVLREVRCAVNEFRDGAWDGVVRSRNRLLRTILVAGVVAVILLDLAVIGSVPKINLSSAVTFFLIGAIVGLFNRLRLEVGSARAIEDFGLFEARLLHTPLLSGLAAVGGVFLMAIVPVVSGVVATGSNPAATAQIPPLVDVFDVTKNPVGLLVAAIFGLAPSSILSVLKDQSDRYKRDLVQSSAMTSEDAAGSTGK